MYTYLSILHLSSYSYTDSYTVTDSYATITATAISPGYDNNATTVPINHSCIYGHVNIIAKSTIGIHDNEQVEESTCTSHPMPSQCHDTRLWLSLC